METAQTSCVPMNVGPLGPKYDPNVCSKATCLWNAGGIFLCKDPKDTVAEQFTQKKEDLWSQRYNKHVDHIAKYTKQFTGPYDIYN